MTTFSISCIPFCFSVQILQLFIYTPLYVVVWFLASALSLPGFFSQLSHGNNFKLLGHRNAVISWYANKAEVKKALISWGFFGGGYGNVSLKIHLFLTFGRGYECKMAVWHLVQITCHQHVSRQNGWREGFLIRIIWCSIRYRVAPFWKLWAVIVLPTSVCKQKELGLPQKKRKIRYSSLAQEKSF